jgi:hypothetical protein
MYRVPVALALIVCGLGRLLANDVLSLKNGDRLTGSVQKLEKEQLSFKSIYSDTVLIIAWDRVAELTTDDEVAITLHDGSVKTATLIAGHSGLTFMDGGSLREIEPAAVVAIEPKPPSSVIPAPSWLRRAWTGSTVSADFGQSFSGLAQYNQLSWNSEWSYKGERWDGSLVSHYNYYGGTDSSGSSYQAYGRFIAERYIRNDHFFLFPYLFYGRQTSSGGGRGQIRQYGGGAGWTFQRHASNEISFSAGMVRSTASGVQLTDSTVSGRSAVPLFIAAASLERKLPRKVTTSVRLYYFKPVTERGHHGLGTDASAKIPLFGPTYFTVRAYDTPEINQTRLFSTKNLQLSSGIGIEF